MKMQRFLWVAGIGLALVLMSRGSPCSAEPVSLFTTQVPATVGSQGDTNLEPGMKFQSDVDGQITAVRSPTEAGSHTGRLWDASGNLLSTATFTSETGSGWQQGDLAAPFSITAGTTCVVSLRYERRLRLHDQRPVERDCRCAAAQRGRQ